MTRREKIEQKVQRDLGRGLFMRLKEMPRIQAGISKYSIIFSQHPSNACTDQLAHALLSFSGQLNERGRPFCGQQQAYLNNIFCEARARWRQHGTGSRVTARV
jgi:hypothetical protein